MAVPRLQQHTIMLLKGMCPEIAICIMFGEFLAICQPLPGYHWLLGSGPGLLVLCASKVAALWTLWLKSFSW